MKVISLMQLAVDAKPVEFHARIPGEAGHFQEVGKHLQRQGSFEVSDDDVAADGQRNVRRQETDRRDGFDAKPELARKQ